MAQLSPLNKYDNRSRFCTGRRCKSVAFTKLKMALFAPMPSANVRMAAAVKPGLFLNILAAYRRSCLAPVSQPLAGGSGLVEQVRRHRLSLDRGEQSSAEDVTALRAEERKWTEHIEGHRMRLANLALRRAH
jgi:hypothetical protein